MSKKNIYFLKPVCAQGPIKIGSSVQPLRRLKSVQIWSPIRLEIAAFCQAHHNTERFLHRHFLGQHEHGEWFSWSPEIQSLIDFIGAHGDVPQWVKDATPTCPSEYRLFIEKYPKGKSRPSAERQSNVAA